MIRPLTHTEAQAALAGGLPLPSGAVPLASDRPATCLILTLQSAWRRWSATERLIKSVDASQVQPEIISAIVALAPGRSSQGLADALGLSRRTVEGWRQGRPISPASAQQILHFLAEVGSGNL